MKTLINTNEIEFEVTAHGAGLKKVLLEYADSPTMLTQFAYGKLFPGDKIPEHSHNTMEEIFYFLKGKGVYTIDHTDWQVLPATVIRIPAGVSHSLTTSGTEELEFLYFGIATQ